MNVRERFRAALLIAVAVQGVARAELVPPKGQTDTRIRTVAYDPEQVYRIKGFVGYHIHIVFAPGESFVGIAGGDNSAIGVDSESNSLWLIPRATSVATNITLLTNKRYYHLQYSAQVREPDPFKDEVIYALLFTYAPDAEAAVRDPARIAAALEQPPRTQNFEYWFCGHASLKPVAAYDDGIHTHIRFKPQVEWPAIYARLDDGSESLVAFNVDAGELIVHRVAKQWVLRRGKTTACIVNRNFSGGSERAEAGTITPQVERRVKESAP